MGDDLELLREYSQRSSEDAFRALVERHAGMVHGAALRMVRDAALAQDITQAVFILLARKAGEFKNGTVVAGWLYRTTRFSALQTLRSERRRQHQHAQTECMNDSAASAWAEVSPCLEEAMSQLGNSERDALVLRFFEEKSFAEVAAALGTSEPAAKMRVGRALEKLRTRLRRQGVQVACPVLLSALATHGVTQAHAGVILSVSEAALAAAEAGAAYVPSTLVKGMIMMTTWNKTRTALVALLVALLLSGTAVVLIKGQPLKAARNASRTTPGFEPMAGEWEGTMLLRSAEGAVAQEQLCSLSVKTFKAGSRCEIEMRLKASPDDPSEIHHYAHTISERGDEIFTVSDPRTGRGDGSGPITEYRKEAGFWRLAVHFPFPGNRGAMDCMWEQTGEFLTINSHDEYYRPQSSNHLYANLRLKRVGARAGL